MQVKPTRMELLRTKRKLKLANKGHDLLKRKRDALVMEFFSVLKDIKALRTDLSSKLGQAQSSLRRAQAIQGELDVERIALGVAAGVSMEESARSVMGVPILHFENVQPTQEWYGYFESTVDLDDAIARYRALLPDIVRLAELQLAVGRLANEIKKTKRRVNSLEYLIIPWLEQMRDSISLKLEELERSKFSQLKRIKKRMT